jgi:hypothetical protein
LLPEARESGFWANEATLAPVFMRLSAWNCSTGAYGGGFEYKEFEWVVLTGCIGKVG